MEKDGTVTKGDARGRSSAVPFTAGPMVLTIAFDPLRGWLERRDPLGWLATLVMALSVLVSPIKGLGLRQPVDGSKSTNSALTSRLSGMARSIDELRPQAAA